MSRLFRAALVALSVWLTTTVPASAQRGLESPSLERPELPPPEQAPVPILPPPPLPRRERERIPATGPKIQVLRFEVTGVTVFSDAEVQASLAPWVGRPISPEELADARRALTLLYVNSGYVNSGARLPSQEVQDGLVRLEVIEGRLDGIEIEGNDQFRDWVLRNRILAGVSTPLNLNELERTLRVLQEDPRILSVDARLDPDEQLGRARVVVRVVEARRFGLDFATNNYRPPSVGSYAGILRARDRNVLGLGDELEAYGEFADGLKRGEGRYTVPLNRWGTRFGVRGRYTESKVVGELDFLNIENDAVTVGLLVDHPVWQTPNDTIRVGLITEWRTTRSYLDGERVSLSAGAVRGRSTVSVARLQGEWQHRDLAQVFVARTTMSMGFDILDATMSGKNRPDGEFFSWLTQIQWARRLPWYDIETVARFDSQLSNDPLLSLEQFAVGGRYSVRGYTENRFVRDQGVIGSLEARIPIWQDGSRRHFVQLAPFFDAAGSWNKGRPTGDDEWIYSVGIGARARIWGGLFAEASWGYAINDVSNLEDDPQADGFSFGLEWQIF